MPKDFMEGYVSVAERTAIFFEKYPEGRIQCGKPEVLVLGDSKGVPHTYVWVQATVYRNPDDLLPSVASAWEEFPGPTQFTKNSEMMNAETSAVGRALAWLGIEVRRGVSSSDERQNRSGPLDYDRESHPPSAPPDWREKFKVACAVANVDLTEVCLAASEGKLSLPDQFRDEERFKLGEHLNRLKSDGTPVPSEASGPEDGPSVLGSKARK